MTYWVYMLRCCDDSFYIGITNSLERRMHEHHMGFKEGCYTFKRLPVELVHKKRFRYIRDAIAWEKRIKRWSRKKKEALMMMDIARLHALSECQNESHSKNRAVMVSEAEP